MQELRIQVEVPAAPQDVWKVYSDYRRWTEWSGVKEVVLRSPGEPEPYGVGAVCVLRARGIAIEQEITGFEPPQRLSWRTVEGLPMRSHEAEARLTPQGRGTLLSCHVRFEPCVPGTGSWMAALYRRELERILARLASAPMFEKGESADAGAALPRRNRTDDDVPATGALPEPRG